MFTMTRLVNLQAEALDMEALEFLVRKAITDTENRGKLQRTMAQLIDCISSSSLSSNPMVWSCFADFYLGIGDGTTELEYRQKQQRALLAETSPDWKQNVPKFETLAEASIILVDCLVREGDSKSMFAAKTQLNSIVKQAESLYSENEWYAKLQAKQAELQ